MGPAPIDMSLRLWSDEISLAPIVCNLGASDVLHVRGESIPFRKSAAPRIAPRHYASVANGRAWTASEVDAWLQRLLAGVRDDPALAAFIQTGQIEGTFWIAVLGSEFIPTPRVDRNLVDMAASMGLTIFVENYTELTDGNPSRSWFAKEPASKAHSRSLHT